MSDRALYPADWFWAADDGRIYASARQIVVRDDDEAFVAWREAGARATPWPRDAAGAQTDAALQAVLSPHGLWVDLAAYAADARWRREVGGVVVDGLAVATDDRSKTMLIGARLAAMADPAWSTVWRASDGAAHPLDAAQMIALADAVSAHVNETFAIHARVAERIATGAVVTREHVDAEFAP